MTTQTAARQKVVDKAHPRGLTTAMCLGIPGRIVEIDGSLTERLALVNMEGVQRKVNIGMLDQEPAVGDWILIHMGFALELIDPMKTDAAIPTRNGAHEDSGAEARNV